MNEPMISIHIISSLNLSLGEYGRQRTSMKFHDLVLNLKFQNSRVLETNVSSTFITAESFGIFLINFKNEITFYFDTESLNLSYIKIWLYTF